MKSYEVVILGGGVAGGTLAHLLRRQNKTVAVVEDNLFGGTCPNRAVIPRKFYYRGWKSLKLLIICKEMVFLVTSVLTGQT